LKYANKKGKNENFEKKKWKKKSHATRIIQPKNQVFRSKGVLCSMVTDRQTDKKVNIEDTFSGFQEFFIQPIIKELHVLSSSKSKQCTDFQYKQCLKQYKIFT